MLPLVVILVFAACICHRSTLASFPPGVTTINAPIVNVSTYLYGQPVTFQGAFYGAVLQSGNTVAQLHIIATRIGNIKIWAQSTRDPLQIGKQLDPIALNSRRLGPCRLGRSHMQPLATREELGKLVHEGSFN